MDEAPDAEKEGFGQGSLGEVSASGAPDSDEMVDESSEGEPGGGESGNPEEYTGGLGDEDGSDQDAEGTASAEGDDAGARERPAEG